MAEDLGLLYAETRARVSALVRGLEPEQEGLTVPATPLWQVRDVVAHLAGLVSDLLAGRAEGAGTPSWTAAHVETRRGRTVAEMLSEWEVGSPRFEDFLRAGRGGAVKRPVVDLVTHEHDIAGALGRTGERECPAWTFALDSYVWGTSRRVAAAGLPAARFDGAAWSATVGEGEPSVTVRTAAQEVFRALAGRRSAAQVRAWDWSSDPEPYLPVLSNFGTLAERDVVETPR